MTSNERNSGRGRFIPTLFNIGGIVLVNVVFLIVLCIFPEINIASPELRETWLCVNVAYLPAIWLAKIRTHEGRAIAMERVMRNALLDVLIHAAALLSLMAVMHVDLAARVYAVYYAMLTPSMLVVMLLGHYILKRYRRSGYNFTRVVIVGTGPTAMRLVQAMKQDPGFGYCILGCFDDNLDPGFEGSYRGGIDDMKNFMATHDVRQIFFTLSGQSDALSKVLKIADDNVAEFYYVPQIPRTLSRKFQLHNIGQMPVLSIRHNPMKSRFNRIVKRGFDLAVSGTFLLFYPLVYIPMAIAIKKSSPGPVYFRQERTGYRGRTFRCLKFRTMKVNSTSDSAQATADDPRKTKIGDFLRRTSIDELPQFLNVWKGDMSVVGPRPHMLKHTEEYTRLVDSYMVRHAVKPGITGWAQVNGYRGITDELWKMERRVECDVWYIENWTLLLDIKIMIRTVLNAVHGEKNAF